MWLRIETQRPRVLRELAVHDTKQPGKKPQHRVKHFEEDECDKKKSKSKTIFIYGILITNYYLINNQFLPKGCKFFSIFLFGINFKLLQKMR